MSLLLVAGWLLVACGSDVEPAAPLGMMHPGQLIDRKDDIDECYSAFEIDDVCGRDPWTPFCTQMLSPLGTPYGLDGSPLPRAAAIATRRYRCPEPGSWTLWTDDRGRILGACADGSQYQSAEESVEVVLNSIRGCYLKPIFNPMPVTSVPGIQHWNEPTGLELRHAPNGTIIYDRSHVRSGEPASCYQVVLDP
jgi:hypothetical protein